MVGGSFIYVFVITFATVFGIENSRFNLNLNVAVELIEAGKTQYNLIQEKEGNTQYGSCWKDAVLHLHDGCKSLSEHVQSDIALKLTDCFLRMSNQLTELDKTIPREEWLQNMSDREFNVYTEFYAHTQNICFYLQSQIWHENTENMINRLSTSSAHVARQLEEAEELQATLLDHQRQSMSVQLELLDNGHSLGQVLHDSRTDLLFIVQEFRSSTLEQQRLLGDLFERLSTLQAWAVGEISWLDTIVFYVTSVIVSYVITAMPRTGGARLGIFVVVTTNFIVERCICTLVTDGKERLEMVNSNLQWWVWLSRRVMVAGCAGLLCLALYWYRDYQLENHRLLLEIQKQNSQLMTFLKTYNLLENGTGRNNPPQKQSSPVESSLLDDGPGQNISQLCRTVSRLVLPSDSQPDLMSKSRMERGSSVAPRSNLLVAPSLLSVVSEMSRSSSPASSLGSSVGVGRASPRGLMELKTPTARYSLRSRTVEVKSV